ncbi:MAG: hypothetical protein R6V26_02025 [Roseovarius sp.]
MTGQGVAQGSPLLAIAWLTRYPPRLWREGRKLGLLVLAHFVVFTLAIGHDEIVAECVTAGIIEPGRAETAELTMALVLFLAWTVLTIAIVRMVDAARSDRGAA